MNFCPLKNVARFARNVECDFFCNFQTLCIIFYFFFFSAKESVPDTPEESILQGVTFQHLGKIILFHSTI